MSGTGFEREMTCKFCQKTWGSSRKVWRLGETERDREGITRVKSSFSRLANQVHPLYTARRGNFSPVALKEIGDWIMGKDFRSYDSVI